MLRREERETSEAATDVEQRLPGLQIELVTDEPELALLRIVEGTVRIRPISAGIRHRAIEHFAIKIGFDVVMDFGDAPGAPLGLRVAQPGPRGSENVPQTVLVTGAYSRSEEPIEELVDRVAIPQTVHVRFAQHERWMDGDPAVPARIAHLDVPRAAAVDADVATGQRGANQALRSSVQ